MAKQAKAKGRVPDLEKDPTIIDRVRSALVAGAPQETAAAYAGISETSFYAWKARGAEELEARARDGEGGELSCYAEFAEAVKGAIAEFKLSCLAEIQSASRGQPIVDGDGTVIGRRPGTWQAAAWLLERRFPDQFAQTQRVVDERASERPQDEEGFRAALETPEGRAALDQLARCMEGNPRRNGGAS